MILALGACGTDAPPDAEDSGEGTDGSASASTTVEPATTAAATSASTTGDDPDDETGDAESSGGGETTDPGTTTGASCADVTCDNDGVCVEDDAGPRCDCDGTGFAGDACSTDVDECAGAEPTCANGGVCSNVDGGYTCDCDGTGYFGSTCESDIDECAEGLDCVNDGVCVNTPGGATCDCSGTGYRGAACSEDVDECTDGGFDCQNGGACQNQAGGYSCLCDGTGYEGDNCSLDIDECALGANCGFGTCNNEAGAYSCDCDGTGYSGPECLTDVDECTESHVECVDNAECVNLTGGYGCACEDGYVVDGGSCVDEFTLLLLESFEGGTAGRFTATTFDGGGGDYSVPLGSSPVGSIGDLRPLDGDELWLAQDANTATNPLWPGADDCALTLTDGPCGYVMVESVFVDDYARVRIEVGLEGIDAEVYETDDFIKLQVAFDNDRADQNDLSRIWEGSYTDLVEFAGGRGGSASRLHLQTVLGASNVTLTNPTALSGEGEAEVRERTEFSYETEASGDEVSFRFQFAVDDGEEVGIDYIRIYGVRESNGELSL